MLITNKDIYIKKMMGLCSIYQVTMSPELRHEELRTQQCSTVATKQ